LPEDINESNEAKFKVEVTFTFVTVIS